MLERHKPTPSTMTEGQIKDLLREAADIESALEIARIESGAIIKPAQEKFDAEEKSLKAQQQAIRDQIHAYLQTNKSRFLKPKSKDLYFGGLLIGTIGFRTVGAKIKITKDAVSSIIANLTRLGLKKLVIVKHSVNNAGLKKHLLAHPEVNIPDVQITPKHDGPFFTVNRNPTVQDK